MNKPVRPKDKSFLPWVIWGIALMTVALVALIVFLGTQPKEVNLTLPSGSPTTTNVAVTVDQESGAIVLGEGPVVLEEYLDMGCPYCGSFYRSSGAELEDYVVSGDLTLKIYALGMLDNFFQDGSFSTRSANSLYCVAQDSPENFFSYLGSLYENQPAEGSAGLDDNALLTLAQDSGVNQTAQTCMTDKTFESFVTEKTQAALNSGLPGTPYFYLNGQQVGSADVVSSVEALIG